MRKINLILIFLFGVMLSKLCFGDDNVDRHIYNFSSLPAYVRISNDSASSSIESDSAICSYTSGDEFCLIPSGGSIKWSFNAYYQTWNMFRLYYSLNPDFEIGSMGGDDQSREWISQSPDTRTSNVFICEEDPNSKVVCKDAAEPSSLYNHFQKLTIRNPPGNLIVIQTIGSFGATGGDIRIDNVR